MANLSYIATTKLIELLRAADPQKNLHVSVLSTNKLGLGMGMQPTMVIDLSREAIVPYPPTGVEKTTDPATNGEPKPPFGTEKRFQQSGKYYFDFKGEITLARSLKEALAEGLKAIERHKPGTLQKLSAVKPRSKRIVARSRGDLFEDRELVESFSEQLMNGWWFGTNNSAPETKSWLRRACDLAELKWDKDFSTSW